MSGSLTEAAAFIAQHWPCFPCGGNKRPITEHGFKDAERDPAAVRRLFAMPGARLIGVPTGLESDIAVVDLDCKDGAAGLEWLAANESRLPRTRRHRTRSGGVHLLFRYPAGRSIRNSASKLAPGVDVRGEGGYIIVPPSDGYAIADDAMPVEMPAWLVDLLDPPKPPPKPPTTPQPTRTLHDGGTPYGLGGLARECEAIRRAAEGTKAETLNKAAYSVGGLVSGGVLYESVARAELRAALRDIEDRCQDVRHAEKILEASFRAGMAAPRSVPETSRPGYVRVTEFIPPEPPPRDEAPPDWEPDPTPDADPIASPAKPHLRADGAKPGLPLVYFNDIQPSLACDDFIEGLLIKGAMSVIYGPSNCGKTFWTSDLALHVATGRRWHDRDIEPAGVIYCALEGSHGISNRVAAWRKHYRLEGVEVPFAVIPVTLNLLDPDQDAARVVDAIQTAAKEFGFPVGWVIMDTLSRAMAGGNENSPEDMGALVTNGTMIQQVTGSHLTWIHHSGKDQAQGARGHSLLRAATDTEIEINRPDKDSPSVAKVTKQRELEIEGEWVFTLDKVHLGTNRRGKPVTSCVVVPFEGDVPQGKRRLSPGAAAGLTALHHALIETGKPGTHSTMPGKTVVTLESWRLSFYARSHLDNQEAKKKAFQRAVKDLREAGAVGVMNDHAWEAREEQDQ